MRPSSQLMFPARSLPTMHDQVHIGACASTSHITSLHSKLVLYACWALGPVDIPADGPAQRSPGIVTSTVSATSLWIDECRACGCTGLLLIPVASSAKQADAPWGFCSAEQHMCAGRCMNTLWEVMTMKSRVPASLVCDWCASPVEATSGMCVVMQAVQGVRWVLYPSSSLLASQRPQ